MRKALVVSVIIFPLLLFANTTSKSYRIFLLEGVNISNSQKKESFSYSLTGNTVNLGFLHLRSGAFLSSPGVVNSWRSPQDNVKTVHVYPNPCNARFGCNGVSFTRLTLECEIRIYSISGEEVRIIRKNSNLDTEAWDLKNKNGQIVASGLYVFFVKGSDGSTKTGKILIIR